MSRALVLGGGFGGVSAAHRLRELDPEVEVVLVTRDAHFMMGFRKNGEVAAGRPMEEGRRPIAALERVGITVRRAVVSRVDPASRAVEADGERIEADALVVALGAARAPEAVPGLREHGIDIYDPAEVPRAARALAGTGDGRVVFGIFGAPYTCPPAPYELAMLVQEQAAARGASVQLSVFTPQPMSLPVLGAEGCQVLEGRLALRGIGFRPNARAERVEEGRVLLEGGEEIPFDVLLAVPPHRCPDLLVEAGLAEPGGWVPVEPRTLETSFDGVWAIGDCVGITLANGQPMPKAGVLAEAEGRVVAERIADRLAGRESASTFGGEGTCWLEVGGGEAMVVRGSFLTEGRPHVELSPASAENLEEKSRYERQRLQAWFGS